MAERKSNEQHDNKMRSEQEHHSQVTGDKLPGDKLPGGGRTDREEYYTVGVIAGTHALRGEVRVLSRTDFPKRRFKQGSTLYLREGQKVRETPLKVASARQHKQFWLVLFEGVSSINDVESWKGLELVVPESSLVALPKDTYYIHQLIGLRVVSDDGREVGMIKDVLKPGANDVYVVRGSLQRNDVLIPAIPDCVLSVDLALNEMKVHLMPGLLDEDEHDNTGENEDENEGENEGGTNRTDQRDRRETAAKRGLDDTAGLSD